MLSVSDLIGHFHPVFVHLPIGILIIACVFQLRFRSHTHPAFQPIIRIMFLWGMIGALASSVTGYLLVNSGDYDGELAGWHQWMGISVTLISAFIYFSKQITRIIRWQWLLCLLLLVFITVTGHLGGTLTHGPGYLTGSWQNIFGDTLATIKRKPIPDVQEAFVYNDIVQPIFESRCYGCHGATKQKGRLRLDKPELITKGGKEGVVIVGGKPKESELLLRLLLPREDEHHMPPKEKSQLTDQQVALVHWWIDGGAEFSKKVKEYGQPEKIKPFLLALQSGNEEKKRVSNVPLSPVEKGDESAIEKLRRKGVMVMPVATNTNYLVANFLVADSLRDSDMALLLPLKKQLVWLKSGSLPIGDSALSIISQCTNLTRLQLDHTKITDKGLYHLRSLKNLQSLNLVGTQVTAAGLMALKECKELQSVYLYQANIRKEEWSGLIKAFPGVAIDSGGYVVPLLETDTMIAKPVKSD